MKENQNAMSGLTGQSRELLKRIDEYFGKETHSVESCQTGRILNLVVNYQDFKPKREVQQFIESLSGDINIESLTRGYSDTAMGEIMLESLGAKEVFVKVDDKTMVSMTLYDLFEEAMFDKIFAEGVLQS